VSVIALTSAMLAWVPVASIEQAFVCTEGTMGLVVTFAVAIILLFLAHKLDDADQMKALNALAANNKL